LTTGNVEQGKKSLNFCFYLVWSAYFGSKVAFFMDSEPAVVALLTGMGWSPPSWAVVLCRPGGEVGL